jgi:hypothetical protein
MGFKSASKEKAGRLSPCPGEKEVVVLGWIEIQIGLLSF